MRRLAHVCLCWFALCAPCFAAHGVPVCGTTRETVRESLFLHRQSARRRGVAPKAAAARDSGNIAVIEDSAGAVDRLNQFNLDGNTLAFVPAGPRASAYTYSVTAQPPDATPAGSPLIGFDDDDSRAFALPFPFPFFGATYTQVFVNSDGNLTFTAPDAASTDRSLGRMTAGPPRISPLFDDLDPSKTAGGVRVFAGPSLVAVTWSKVPEYSTSGTGASQTFQVRLYPDGRIEFSYTGVAPTSAVVGIAPGNLAAGAQLVDFRSDPSAVYSSTVAEVFANSLSIDTVTVAQQFYQSHEDAYDYLVIYNNMGIPARGDGTIAYEQTVRNSGSGFGVPVLDSGMQFGSRARLRSVLNMGPLSQYPLDPNALVPARAPQQDTPLTVLAHEAGHLFLAYASVRSSADPASLPMLGFQLAHWSFLFNSEASLLEGERIADRGTSAPLRFLTTDITQAYSPLDQYLMGFRAPDGVPPTFVVTNSALPAASHQVSGIEFDGVRRDISVNDVIQAEGRRTPDSTVAQRRFRFAFVLLVAKGSQPAAAELAQLDAYRTAFEGFFAQAASGNATAETTLKRSLKLSLFPAAGVAEGGAARATIAVESAADAPLVVRFAAPTGHAEFPASVTIPAGATSTNFEFTGVRAGVEELEPIPAEAAYETAFARVQVAAASTLRLTGSLNGNTVTARLSDANNLPYPGARIAAAPSPGGAVVPSEALTDSAGEAVFTWNFGPAPLGLLRLSLPAVHGSEIYVPGGSGAPVIQSVWNAASQAAGFAPGALEIVNGANFKAEGARVLLNGVAVPVVSATATAIEFYAPLDTPLGAAVLTVETASAAVNVVPAAPGIFPGGIVHVGGKFLEIYCTGLGVPPIAPVVFIGATSVEPVYAAAVPGSPGLYQINVQVPAGLAPGVQPVMVSESLAHSNVVNITVQ